MIVKKHNKFISLAAEGENELRARQNAAPATAFRVIILNYIVCAKLYFRNLSIRTLFICLYAPLSTF